MDTTIVDSYLIRIMEVQDPINRHRITPAEQSVLGHLESLLDNAWERRSLDQGTLARTNLAIHSDSGLSEQYLDIIAFLQQYQAERNGL